MRFPISYWLIYLRMLLGPLLCLLCYLKVPAFPFFAVLIVLLGLLSDIFDGINARRQGISEERLRRMDSMADQLFFICIALTTYFTSREFYQHHTLEVLLLLSSEALIYLVSYCRFQRGVATHSIGAKLWTLFLTATLIELFIRNKSGWLFQVTIWLGIATRLEILGILIVVTSWAHDVPSIWHAWKLRKGLPVKRHKLFNG